MVEAFRKPPSKWGDTAFCSPLPSHCLKHGYDDWGSKNISNYKDKGYIIATENCSIAFPVVVLHIPNTVQHKAVYTLINEHRAQKKSSAPCRN